MVIKRAMGGLEGKECYQRVAAEVPTKHAGKKNAERLGLDNV